MYLNNLCCIDYKLQKVLDQSLTVTVTLAYHVYLKLRFIYKTKNMTKCLRNQNEKCVDLLR